MAVFAKPGRLPLLLALLSSVSSVVLSSKFEVGGSDGWVIPSSKDAGDDFYNQWAAEKRFQVGDTLSFKYKKDSVMVVTDEEYENCRSTQPVFFSNNGKTEFQLDRPGLFYFISGINGHCERGEKMIIKVLDSPGGPRSPSGSPPGGRKSDDDSSDDDDAAVLTSASLMSIFLAIVGTLLSVF
ncbi:Early nodulin-like protein 1 [Apostasia shenzhenica]|uniref:Early nodulin-like protein 1 n=1 Tax=Apostasia shenzhenica TaxID=1088818 RepID=A0A2I0AXH3_9ASPA|nr:Early nodulin-like protein 1 [Apostasia shenzhenica]